VDPVFSTANVDPQHRFEYWHDVACKLIIGHVATPRSRSEFEAVIHKSELGSSDLIAFENGAMDAARTINNVQQSPDDSFLICRQLEGEVQLEQASRQCVLTAGQLTVLDGREPYIAVFPERSKMLLLKAQRSALDARFGRFSDVTARPLRESGIGALAADQLAVLPTYAGIMDSTAQATTLSYILDLIAMSAAKVLGDASKRSDLRSLAVSRLRACVEARLDDPLLDPSSIAAAAGFSVRYAQALLADQGTSIMRLVQSRRIEKCKSALTDPTQSHRTVGDIAFAWGFADLTHFSRVFKAHVGMTAGEYRRAAFSEGQGTASPPADASNSPQD